MSESLRQFRELRVYQTTMTATLQIFEITKTFPAEEKFSLTDQIRRSSRSVCANIAEAWRKRRYEAAETQVWLEIARHSGYLNEPTFNELDATYESILSMLIKMISDPSKWTIRK